METCVRNEYAAAEIARGSMKHMQKGLAEEKGL
jgi:hypothetical protein